MPSFIRLFGFAQNVPVNQSRTQTEDAQHAVGEVHDLFVEMSFRLQALDEDQWRQLTYLSESLGFDFIDLPTESPSLGHPTLEIVPGDQMVPDSGSDRPSTHSSSASVWMRLKRLGTRLMIGNPSLADTHVISQHSAIDHTITTDTNYSISLVTPYPSNPPSPYSDRWVQSTPDCGHNSEDLDGTRLSREATAVVSVISHDGQGLQKQDRALTSTAVVEDEDGRSITFHSSAEGRLDYSDTSVEPSVEPRTLSLSLSDHARFTKPIVNSLDYHIDPVSGETYAADLSHEALLALSDYVDTTENEVAQNIANQPIPPLDTASQCLADILPSTEIGCHQARPSQMETDCDIAVQPSPLNSENIDMIDVETASNITDASPVFDELSSQQQTPLTDTYSVTPSDLPSKATGSLLFMKNNRIQEICDPQALSLLLSHYEVEALKPELLSRAISTSYFSVRNDAYHFIQNHVLWWQYRELWSQRPSYQYSGNESTVHQFLCEMDWVEMEADTNTNLIRKRFSLMRLYYWYERYLENLKAKRKSGSPIGLGRGRDIRTAAKDYLLKLYYPDWPQSQSLRPERRKKLERNIRCGRQWCSYAQYLGYGAVLLASGEMNPFMNDRNIPKNAIHALAIFIANMFADGLKLCQALDPIAMSILTRRNINISLDLATWYNSLQQFLNSRDDPGRFTLSQRTPALMNETISVSISDLLGS